MEVPREVQGLLREEITIWNAAKLYSLSQIQQEQIGNLINEMGRRSAISQGLGAPITSLHILLTQTDQTLYVCSSDEGKLICGILKVGKKRLFMRISSEQNGIVEITPLCCLDIYIETSLQRNGLGKRMFEVMLEKEHSEAWQLAYDKPSPKLQGFLRKHYNLTDYIPQVNNYIVFSKYFKEHKISTVLPTVSTPPPSKSITTTTTTTTTPIIHSQSPQYSSSPSLTTRANSPGRSQAVTLISTPLRSGSASSTNSTPIHSTTITTASPGSWPYGVPDIPLSQQQHSRRHNH